MQTGNSLRIALTGAVLALGLPGDAQSADAQTINIDFGHASGLPANTFGAAAASPGHWNPIVQATTSHLLNVGGATTAVGVNVVADSFDGNSFVGTSEPAKLRGDNMFAFNGRHWSVTLSNLENGLYQVYLYAPTNTAVPTRPFTVNGTPVANLTGANSDSLNQGSDWTKVAVEVTGGTLLVASSSTSGSGGLSGMQLVAQGSEPVVPEPTSVLLFLPTLGVVAVLQRCRRV